MTPLPDSPGQRTPKLGLRQREFLRRVCDSNGGGVYVGMGGPEWKIAQRLYGLGLVQGKSGSESCAVHTREGLDLHRKLSAGAP